MKGIFRSRTTSSSRSDGSRASASSSSSVQPGRASPAGFAARIVSALGPQYSVPPFPHPLPDRALSIHCSSEGVVILPLTSSQRHPHQHAPDTLPRTSDEGAVQDIANEVSLNGSVEHSTSAAHIAYGRDGKVQPASTSDINFASTAVSVDEQNPTIHSYGIIGILRVFNAAYLFAITSRSSAGDYLRPDRPIYRCSGVLVIPLTPEGARATLLKEAKRQAYVRANLQQKDPLQQDEDEDEESEEDDTDDVVTPSIIPKDSFNDQNPLDSTRVGHATLKPNKSAAWLSRPARATASDGGAQEQQDNDAQTIDPSQAVHEPQSDQDVAPPMSETTIGESVPLSSDERWHEATKAELEDKVVKEAARQYSRGEMWFTYDFDLTSSLQKKQAALEQQKQSTSSSKAKSQSESSNKKLDPNTEPYSTLPLWRRADRKFWHNEHLSKDFIDAGLHSLVLPMMQGYVQITHLPIHAPSPPARALDISGDAMDAVSEVVSHDRMYAQLLIISRRSKERAGLRYQRRGVNGQGQVANYVESEQILLVRRGDAEAHVLSFVQLRGSIPLYWKQDPFSMKPPPMLEGSAEENRKAFAKHFDSQVQRYDRVVCINLAEQHGKEGVITKAYADAVKQYNKQSVAYKAFDFHEECKGMRFERVGKLIDELRDTELKDMDCYWKSVSTNAEQCRENVYSRQNGAFRVSCLDCLDRTNVVQSAFGRYMLGVQLERLGVHVGPNEAFDFAFNDSWANNGDMVSQIYAGTRALKGDFTRTGKRNLMGMMNDATNSVYRMVQGAVTDFFKQTVIDFQYGYASLATLERYNDNLAAPDPSQANRLARARAAAVESSAHDIISKDEKLLAGWTLFSPVESSRIETPKLEEKVVLLTNKALYSCGYDFTAQKLAEFSKIKLGDIIGIKRGVYILSPSEGYHPENHWGLVVHYIDEERRLNTSSIRSKATTGAAMDYAASANGTARPNSPTKFIAFRAVIDEATVAALQQLSNGNDGNSSIKLVTPNFLAKLRQEQNGISLTSHDVINTITSVLVEQCIAAGSCDEDDVGTFVTEETIQSLAQAKANASLFAPLIEGIKRRVWL